MSYVPLAVLFGKVVVCFLWFIFWGCELALRIRLCKFLVSEIFTLSFANYSQKLWLDIINSPAVRCIILMNVIWSHFLQPWESIFFCDLNLPFVCLWSRFKIFLKSKECVFLVLGFFFFFFFWRYSSERKERSCFLWWVQ